MMIRWLKVINNMLGYEEGPKLVKAFFEHSDWENKNHSFSRDDVIAVFDALRQISIHEWGECYWEEHLPWFEDIKQMEELMEEEEL